MIKAHVIPEAFFREVRVGSETPILVSAEAGQFPKMSPIGVYDEGILCERCEAKFGVCDDYAISLLLKDFASDFTPISDSSRLAGFESPTANADLLLKFLVAVLWRASVSTQDFYANVNLGPHLESAASVFTKTEQHVPVVFDAVLSRWKDPDKILPPTVILDPKREKMAGVNVYRVYLGETVAYVKVDAQPFPAPLKRMSLRAAPPIFIVARNMSKSNDLEIMKRVAIRSHLNTRAFNSRRSGEAA